MRGSLWRCFYFPWRGHWILGWFAYMDERNNHGLEADTIGYVTEMSRDTFENWQSEFLQLLWQVGGLAFFLYVGSPQSKEGDDRKEAKLDAILRRLAPADAAAIIQEIDAKYQRQ
jgi:hypothetical protein